MGGKLFRMKNAYKKQGLPVCFVIKNRVNNDSLTTKNQYK
jgi:hypothetical protein